MSSYYPDKKACGLVFPALYTGKYLNVPFLKDINQLPKYST